MYRLIFFLWQLIFLTPFLVLSQEKEEVYLLFDKSNNEKCVFEDGSGKSISLSKYRTESEGNTTYFIICDERFAFNEKKSRIDTCSLKAFDNIKIVDIDYINKKKNKNILKSNPFKNIFLIKKISNDRIVKYEVTWMDDWLMVED